MRRVLAVLFLLAVALLAGYGGYLVLTGNRRSSTGQRVQGPANANTGDQVQQWTKDATAVASAASTIFGLFGGGQGSQTLPPPDSTGPFAGQGTADGQGSLLSGGASNSSSAFFTGAASGIFKTLGLDDQATAGPGSN